MFDAIRKGDILLPSFQSFKPVIAFVDQAAKDPDVVAIKQTVYRTGAVRLMRILMMRRAAEGDHRGGGADGALRRRGQHQLGTPGSRRWARRLRRRQPQTHAKLAMVVRREHDRLRRYCHIGTGNYHSRTSTLYTDFGLFTCDEEICADVNDVFLQLTGLGKASKLRHLWQSPFTLHSQLVAAIKRESVQAKTGKKCGIIAKMNALLEPEIIAELYEASKAGVKIELIVRGVYGLRPGLPGCRRTSGCVRSSAASSSIIGYFISSVRETPICPALTGWSAQFLPPHRSLCACPGSETEEAGDRGIPQKYLDDNLQAWDMGPDGRYERCKPGKSEVRGAQLELLQELASAPQPDTEEQVMRKLRPKRKARAAA
jgi:polyphosphate kinase